VVPEPIQKNTSKDVSWIDNNMQHALCSDCTTIIGCRGKFLM
jgi:hypothetical protein